MFITIGKPKTIYDLKEKHNDSSPLRRHIVSICIIDDEPFSYADLLTKHDFNIRELGDINDIKAVESYDIVLCDIKGVGKSFGSHFEGGHIIEEIKKLYPSKVLVAYSGQQFDPTFNKFYQLADFSVKKDISSDEWIAKLDDSIKLVKDPVYQWKKIRENIIKLDISAYHLLKLEDEFVNKMMGNIKNFPSKKLLKSLPADVRTIILNFISSLIFKIIVG
jgi:hypothetical protein